MNFRSWPKAEVALSERVGQAVAALQETAIDPLLPVRWGPVNGCSVTTAVIAGLGNSTAAMP